MNELNLNNLGVWREKNPQWIIVKPNEDEVEWIKKNGIARNKNGQESGFKSRTKDLSDEWNIHGLAGEFAASLFYRMPIGRITSRCIKELNSGDISDFIEVKATRGKHPWLWDILETERYIKPDRAYVGVISCLFPDYLIITGWQWGREFYTGRLIPEGVHGFPVRALSRDRQMDPKSLWDEIINRDRAKIELDKMGILV